MVWPGDHILHSPYTVPSSAWGWSELVSVVWWCAAGAVPPAGDQHLHHNRKVSAWTRRRCRPITGRRGQAGRRRRAVIGRRVAAAGWAGQAVSQCGAVSWQCFSRTVGSSQWTAPGSHYSPVSAALWRYTPVTVTAWPVPGPAAQVPPHLYSNVPITFLQLPGCLCSLATATYLHSDII